MIKVTENGVPLAAVSSVEFAEPASEELRASFMALDYSALELRVLAHGDQQTACNRWLIEDVRRHPLRYAAPPLLKLPMTEAEAKSLRDEWAQTWRVALKPTGR